MNLKDYWEYKYIDRNKTFTTKSLSGNITYYYDKWGAMLFDRNTFGNDDRIYSCELEYIDAIKHLITIKRYEDLLKTRDKTSEKDYNNEFNFEDAVKEEIERRKWEN